MAEIEETETKTTEPTENKNESLHTLRRGDSKQNKVISRELPAMNDVTYLRDRLEAQLQWFESKATLNQKRYKKFKRIEFTLAASIPVFISFASTSLIDSVEYLPFVFNSLAAIAGVFLAVINSLMSLEEYFRNWKEYRITSEELRHEKIKYLTYSDPYDEEDTFHVLVNNVEAILNKENQSWRNVTAQKQSDLVRRSMDLLNKKKATRKKKAAAEKAETPKE